MYCLFCMASKNNFPGAHLLEHLGCSLNPVVQYLSLAYPQIVV